MHMAKGTIVSLFTVFSAYISSVQCREATSGNRVEEAGVDLGGGGGVTIYIYIYTYILIYLYIYIYTQTPKATSSIARTCRASCGVGRTTEPSCMSWTRTLPDFGKRAP